jgi:hypothetical protein
MEMDILQSLDTLGLIPFLVWMHIKAEKRQDLQSERMEAIRHENEERHEKMVRGWEKQLNEVIAKYEERELALRSRYDKVVEGYNRERDKLFMDIDRKLDDVIRFTGSRNG